MSEFHSIKEATERSSEAGSAAAAASPAAESAALVVNVPLRRILVDDLNQHQRQLSDFVAGFIGARDRELAITRIWERYFASPSRRAFLDDSESWAEVAELLDGIDSFGTLLRNELGTVAAEWAVVFDEELKSMRDKISAARFDDSPPADSANEVRRCVEKIRPAVREIRVMCQNGVEHSLRELSMRIERIFEVFELRSTGFGEAGLTTAEKLASVAEEGAQATGGVKTSASEDSREGQAATKEGEGDISMETAS